MAICHEQSFCRIKKHKNKDLVLNKAAISRPLTLIFT